MIIACAMRSKLRGDYSDKTDKTPRVRKSHPTIPVNGTVY